MVVRTAASNSSPTSHLMAYPVIGHVEGRLAADHDTIAVTGPHDNFRRSKFKVTDAAVYLKELLVIYDNGAPDRIPVREDIPKVGGEPRDRSARRGHAQPAQDRVLVRHQGRVQGKADVTVFGMK
jgi:hypothetical protein